MNYDLLFSGSDSEKVEIAIIGVSGFNHSLFKYGMRSDKLSIRVLCGRNIQKCIDAYESNGVDKADIIHCKDREEGIAAYKDGKYLIFNDVSLAMQMPFHVVVEGTGHPEASAGYALAAIENGKHVIAVTKESDTVVGSLLARKARDAGVIYSLAVGDQPALLIGLISWARTAGLKIVSVGKSSEYDFIYDPDDSTVEVLGEKISVKEFGEVWDLGEDYTATVKRRSKLLDAFNQRAIPDLAEMSIVCNHLPDFSPDKDDFHYPIARTLEVPDLMCPKDMGGLFSKDMRIDVYNCLRRTDEQSMEGGVYVVVACDDQETWDVLKEKGVPLSKNGKTALIYYPAHYLGFETIFSVLSVGKLNIPTSSVSPEPRYDLVSRATKPLKKGTKLKAQGHHHIIEGLEGVLLPAARIDHNKQLPYYLADGTTLACDVSPGDLITAEMLETPDDAILWKLRGEQDDVFFK